MFRIVKQNTIFFSIVLIVFCCVVTRLPQFLSPYLMLDGDEAVEGLMSMHVYMGKHLPVFFYGQAYGFSLIENLVAAGGYMLFGISDYTLKAAMLLMWTIGIIFYYLAFLKVGKSGNVVALIVAIAFVVNPAWAVWAMKARGGYTTSFLLFPVVLYLLFGKGDPGTLRWILIGVFTVLIANSQPLWIPGLTPFIVYKLVMQRSPRALLFAVLGALIVFIPITILKQHLPHIWQGPQLILTVQNIQAHIIGLPDYLYNGMHGWTELGTVFNVPPTCAAITRFFCFALIILPIAALYNLFRPGKRNWLFITSVVAVLFSIVAVLPIENNERPRWLLAIPCIAIVSFFLLYDMIKAKLLYKTVSLVYVLVGFVVIWQFRDFNFYHSTRQQLTEALQTLERKGIRYTFAKAELAFQVPFYSKERVISRPGNIVDRYMPYITEVDKALDDKLPVAYIHYTDDSAPPGTAGVIVEINPTRERLQQEGFRF